MKNEIISAVNPPAGSIQFIAFEVGPERYVLPIQAVVEFRTWVEPTPIPNAAPHVRGVINVRGEIVPIFDVSARLGKTRTDATPRHVVILVRGSDQKTFGLLVDAVSDIISVSSAEIAALPQMEEGQGRSYLVGVVPTGDALLGVIDLELFASEATAVDAA